MKLENTKKKKRRSISADPEILLCASDLNLIFQSNTTIFLFLTIATPFSIIVPIGTPAAEKTHEILQFTVCTYNL